MNRFLLHVRLELLWLEIRKFYWRRRLKSALKTNKKLMNFLAKLEAEENDGTKR